MLARFGEGAVGMVSRGAAQMIFGAEARELAVGGASGSVRATGARQRIITLNLRCGCRLGGDERGRDLGRVPVGAVGARAGRGESESRNANNTRSGIVEP